MMVNIRFVIGRPENKVLEGFNEQDGHDSKVPRECDR